MFANPNGLKAHIKRYHRREVDAVKGTGRPTAEEFGKRKRQFYITCITFCLLILITRLLDWLRYVVRLNKKLYGDPNCEPRLRDFFEPRSTDETPDLLGEQRRQMRESYPDQPDVYQEREQVQETQPADEERALRIGKLKREMQLADEEGLLRIKKLKLQIEEMERRAQTQSGN